MGKMKENSIIFSFLIQPYAVVETWVLQSLVYLPIFLVYHVEALDLYCKKGNITIVKMSLKTTQPTLTLQIQFFNMILRLDPYPRNLSGSLSCNVYFHIPSFIISPFASPPSIISLDPLLSQFGVFIFKCDSLRKMPKNFLLRGKIVSQALPAVQSVTTTSICCSDKYSHRPYTNEMTWLCGN